ncbi:autotransporter outer membrane beta-barrel domain-containing protein [Celeribacter sp. PS-C1]|uniref:autotransporter outer membrane beta-barrel domain-containing protein n=1 Tax=Celeribacter sp. PS-C1 TaxID=2820813 RepID=UPI001CA4FC7E|nr:autotransporter outer membrane beta-barrel domain-containing protein [Celeribacter sp. PS-C1]MBW6418294.1 autotransporter outer membrane beta-barrel domain-containing protein [Celeribacter sp. PS-C1]
MYNQSLIPALGKTVFTSVSPIALISAFSMITPGAVFAACDVTVNGDGGQTVVCNPANDPAGAPFSTTAFDDTVTVTDVTAAKVTLGDGADTITVDGTGIVGSGTAVFAIGLDAGDGDDTIYVNDDGQVVGELFAGDGNDEIYVTGGSTGRIRLDSGDDYLEISGGTVAAVGHSAAKSNTGSNTIIVSGGTITDQLMSGLGADTITLTGGTIRYVGGNSDADVITLDGASIAEYLRGGWNNQGIPDGDDQIYLYSGSVGNSVLGDAGSDLIILDGADIGEAIIGGGDTDAADPDGDDTIEWHSGNLGTNVAHGVLAGGAGSDTFLITADEYNGSQVVTGGLYSWSSDEVVAEESGDEYFDELTFDGIDGITTQAEYLAYLESITFENSTMVIEGGELEVLSDDAGNGVHLVSSQLTFDDGLSVLGNVDSDAASELALAGSASISGDYVNDGETTLVTGAAGDTLEVGGTYSGSGTLSLEIDAETGDADMLDVASLGATSNAITVYVLGATDGVTEDSTWTLVSVADGSGADDAFYLVDGPVEMGALYYDLEHQDESYVLASTGEFAESVAAYEAYTQILIGMLRMDALRNRTGGTHDIGEGALTLDTPVNVWAQIAAGTTHSDGINTTSGVAHDLDLWALQAGVDRLLFDSEDLSIVAGLNFEVANGSATTTASSGDGAIDLDAKILVGTLTWYGQDGTYVDAQAKLAFYDATIGTEDGNVSNSGKGHGLSLEIGHRSDLGQGYALTPQAQLQYTKVAFDDFTDANGIDVALQDGTQYDMRLGLMLERNSVWQPDTARESSADAYGIVNLYRGFGNGTTVTASQAALASDANDWSGEIGLGGKYHWAGGKYAVFGEVTAATGLDNFGESYAINGEIGFRMTW